MHQSNLPQEWEITKLGNYIFLKNGYAFKTKGYCEKNNNSTPVIRISDIDGIWASDENAVYTKEIPTGFNVRKGDLLIAMSGATTGKIGIYNGNEPAYQNQRVGNLKLVNEELGDNCFRNHLITYLQDDILKLAHGGAQPNIAGKTIENIEIALPPLAEQTHLAKLLDDLTARVQKIQESLDKIPALLKTFRQSVLARAVSGELTEKWREKNNCYFSIEDYKLQIGKFEIKAKGLGDVYENNTWLSCQLGHLFSVQSGKGLTSEKMCGGHIPVYGGNGITGYHNEQNIDEETIVIGRVGFYCGSIHLTSKDAWVTDNALIVSFPKNCINKKFAYYLLLSMNLGKQSASTAQPVISGAKIYPISMKIPPYEEQKQIVAQVEHYFGLADEIERQTKQAQEKVNYLTQSILAKAFRGELTANWRIANQALISGENSAKALLAKIESEVKKEKKK